jgi:hypothetical protein
MSCRLIWIAEARPHQGSLVLWQNPDADLPRSNADDKGENDRSLIAPDIKTRPLNQASALRPSAS